MMSDLVLRKQNMQDLFLLGSSSSVVSDDQLLFDVMTRLDDLIAGEFDVGIVFAEMLKTA